MKHLISGLWAKLLVGIGAVVATSVFQYGGLIWCSPWLEKCWDVLGAMMADVK
jgi:hypothetical protein